MNEQARDLYPIRTVSELTGVNAITLRAWEQRHQLINPIRKASGHRLYTQEHIDLINRVVGMLDRGMRIGQVKAALDTGERGSEGNAAGVDDTWQRHINGMIAAVIRFDEQGLERIYGEVLSHYPVRVVTEKLIRPLLVELGERWVSGNGSVAEEHFFGFYLRNKLGARFHHRPQNQTGPLLLLACLPGDLHEIGLLLFALSATDNGYRTVILGANMPLDEMPAAISKTGCDAVVLSGVIGPDQSILKKELPRLSLKSSVPVFIGGSSSVAHFDGLKSAGAHPLGNDIESGLRTLSVHLGYTN